MYYRIKKARNVQKHSIDNSLNITPNVQSNQDEKLNEQPKKKKEKRHKCHICQKELSIQMRMGIPPDYMKNVTFNLSDL